MGYYHGTDDEGIGGLGCGPGCSCGPCRRGVDRGVGLAQAATPIPAAGPVRSSVATALPAAGPGYYTYGPAAHRYGTADTVSAIRSTSLRAATMAAGGPGTSARCIARLRRSAVMRGYSPRPCQTSRLT